MTSVNTTADFCAICRDEEIPTDFITRCSHCFHFKCLWPGKYKAETSKPCPFCRRTVSNFIEKEKILSNMKILKLDKDKNENIINFLDMIMDFKKSIANSAVCKFSPIADNIKLIPSYGKEMIENLTKLGWNVHDKSGGGIDLLKRICERDDLYRLNLLIDNGLKLNPGSEYEMEATNTATAFFSNLVLERITSEKLRSTTQKLKVLSLKIYSGDQLIEACQNNNFEMVKYFVEKGVDVNSRDTRGARPIHKACASASLDIINYLISKGAEINSTDLNGKNPIHEACISNYDRKDVVKRLLDLKANVSYLDQDRNTQLHVAIISRKYEIAEMLIDKYENIDLLNIFDESPLHLASDFAPKSLIEKLIEKGSDITAKDFKERSALHRAIASNTVDVVDILLSNGADSNQVDKNKDTAVLLAIKRTDAKPLVSCLIKHGADLNIKDLNGKTAFEIYMDLYN